MSVTLGFDNEPVWYTLCLWQRCLGAFPIHNEADDKRSYRTFPKSLFQKIFEQQQQHPNINPSPPDITWAYTTNLQPQHKMKIKRSKQYRKLMQQYQLNFGFREPYQVLGMYSLCSLHGAKTPSLNDLLHRDENANCYPQQLMRECCVMQISSRWI